MTSNINHFFDKLVANSKTNKKEIQGGNRDEKVVVLKQITRDKWPFDRMQGKMFKKKRERETKDEK